jgi:transitional endoplasmic reticulum ATPase
MGMPEGAAGSSLQLRAVPTSSELDSGRGLVRIAPSVLQALGARPYSVVKLTGGRVTAALVAQSTDRQDPGAVIVDELILGNLGVAAGTAVTAEVEGGGSGPPPGSRCGACQHGFSRERSSRRGDAAGIDGR